MCVGYKIAIDFAMVAAKIRVEVHMQTILKLSNEYQMKRKLLI
jgi:hypothetical protein